MIDPSGTKPPTTPEPIKVLIVEDSPTMCQLLLKLLDSDPGLKVVGVARDGAEAIRLVGRVRPNVITMDVRMPNMDGLEATEYIMAHHPTPIMVLTSSLAKQDVDLSFKMLSAGALEIVEKPALGEWDVAGRNLIERLKLLSRIKVITHIRAKSKLINRTIEPPRPLTPPPSPPPAPPRPTVNRDALGRFSRDNAQTKPLALPENFNFPATPSLHSLAKERRYVILSIAASTGGPPALSKLLSALPLDLPVPVLVVQHIPAGFGTGLAEWLDGETPLKVKNAEQGEMPRPGVVYLPADDRHLLMGLDGKLYLSDAAPRMGLRPSADITFESLAEALPGKTLNVILTGMGRDGTAGMRALKKAGGYNIAQDETTSVIFGMPKSAIEAQVVDRVLPLQEIAAYVRTMLT